jgi:segregation and condensation protein A
VDGIAAPPAAGQGGEGSSPWLDLAGFHGRLERLLALARSHRIDLARIALPALVDQLIAALRDAGGRTPLGLQAEWVVMAAWLVQLRSRLLLPAEAPASDAAHREAAQLRRGLARLDAVHAAARWLDGQPRLGRDVFARGRPELMGIGTAAPHQVDVVEFLWASLALLDDDLARPDTTASYRPAWRDLHAVSDARDRILRRMADGPDPCRLDQLLPDPSGPGAAPEAGLRGRSRWTSTFVASLELAKQGDVVLEQEEAFSPLQVGNVDRMQAMAQADGDA